MQEITTHEMHFAIIADKATRQAILAADGTIERTRCCDSDDCGCSESPDRAYDKVSISVTDSRDLFGDGPIDPDKVPEGSPLGFSCVSLYQLTSGLWIKRTHRFDRRFDRLKLCKPETVIQAWQERREQYRKAGGGCYYTDIEVGIAPHPSHPNREPIPGRLPWA